MPALLDAPLIERKEGQHPGSHHQEIPEVTQHVWLENVPNCRLRGIRGECCVAVMASEVISVAETSQSTSHQGEGGNKEDSHENIVAAKYPLGVSPDAADEPTNAKLVDHLPVDFFSY